MAKVKWIGKERAFRQLKRVVPAVEDDLKDALEMGAVEVADLARLFAPKRTGKYARTITAKERATANGLPSWGVFASYIWRFIEFGTKSGRYLARVGMRKSDVKQHKTLGRRSYRTHPGNPAQPHLWPAYRVVKRRMMSRITRSINKAIKRAG
ncbi:HK97 gp10 family phage protein [Cohaesibacter haloalkalitolerans]|uniref:HK97 gp10 family phage protein n=1 Tax=Cohaesibacter haloalkalitolerans TaxID=1162980 RepID=UPI000E65753F|nr:HK97 gp10 family phage protein [Cohaesibacter haloalkalitolerans]